jgi:hypothetical protein
MKDDILVSTNGGYHWISLASDEIRSNCGFDSIPVDMKMVDCIIARHWVLAEPNRAKDFSLASIGEKRATTTTDYTDDPNFWIQTSKAWMINAAMEIDCAMKMPRFDLAIQVAAQIIAVNYARYTDLVG